MAKFDKIYKDIVETINNNGIWSEGMLELSMLMGLQLIIKVI